MNAFQQKLAAFQEIYDDLQKKDRYYYLQQVDRLGGARVEIGGREMVMFSSYSYLGLLKHPRIEAAAKSAIDRFGTGTHGVRILAGTTALHNQLEENMARFMGTGASIAYSSGYAANFSTISILTGRHDIVISDRLSHASIVDGCMLTQAEFVRFKHNDLADLDRLLEKSAEKYQAKLVVVDAVYSMDGDLCPLPELLELCRKHGAWLMVDEAHSLGVLGKTGRGILEHFGIPSDQPGLILSGSLSKTIPSVGGYVAARAEVINFLKHNARSFVFSAALPPASAAAAMESFAVMEEEQWRLEAVRRNIRRFVSGLNAMGYNTLGTQSCVIPIIIGQPEPTLALTSALHADGMFVSPILPPAVPPGTCRLRANVTSAHTDADIDFALGLLEKHGRRMGIIGAGTGPATEAVPGGGAETAAPVRARAAAR